MRFDNQLFRVAEIALRNEERLLAWRYRYEEYQMQHQAAKKENNNVCKTNA